MQEEQQKTYPGTTSQLLQVRASQSKLTAVIILSEDLQSQPLLSALVLGALLSDLGIGKDARKQGGEA